MKSFRSPFARVGLVLLFVLMIASLAANGYFLWQTGKISPMTVRIAQKLTGLGMTAPERHQMQRDLRSNLRSYEALRQYSLDNGVAPAIGFDPLPPGEKIRPRPHRVVLSPVGNVRLPENLEDVAFYTVPQLAQLIRSRQITSERLTRLYLERLRTYGPLLNCVITLTDSLALDQARRADREIAAGRYRGPLHGIPYGIKDLFAVKEYLTTWGAAPYREQYIPADAAVVTRLREAGAVLVAKLSMGALAMDDVWFGGMTKNPWNPEEGSSGSSAGSAAATAAGLVGFSIGTETWGSIVSPSTRCRVTGFRPTFGRVSRQGAMALSWSMDKVGPICRSVEGCALVFDAIQGADGLDRAVRQVNFEYDSRIRLGDLRVGFLESVFEEDSSNKAIYDEMLGLLRDQGAELIPLQLPEFPVWYLSFILEAEAAAAFDELTRSNRDDLLVRQGRGDWPNLFREARFIPAVEYIQANRFRLQVMEAMADTMTKVDIFIAPSFGGSTLLLTNLTGHPTVCVPIGTDSEGHSLSLSFIGRLFEDGRVLAAARIFQEATDFHRRYPDLEELKKAAEK